MGNGTYTLDKSNSSAGNEGSENEILSSHLSKKSEILDNRSLNSSYGGQNSEGKSSNRQAETKFKTENRKRFLFDYEKNFFQYKKHRLKTWIYPNLLDTWLTKLQLPKNFVVGATALYFSMIQVFYTLISLYYYEFSKTEEWFSEYREKIYSFCYFSTSSFL